MIDVAVIGAIGFVLLLGLSFTFIAGERFGIGLTQSALLGMRSKR